MALAQKQDAHLTLEEVSERAGRLIRGMMSFWKSAHGWAPIEAAELLSKSMLEWQSSLADCLGKWTGQLTPGELILGWANIGALVEGQLKLFLSVWYKDYVAKTDVAIKHKGVPADPDGVTLEPLRVYFKQNVWTAHEQEWDDWILMVLQRRNAIHAYKAKTIGDSEELHEALRLLLKFVRAINARLPYPDDIYVPREG